MAIIKKIFLEPKDPKCLGIKIDGVQYPARTAKEANAYQIKRLLSNNQYKVYEELVVDGITYHIPLSIKNFDTDNTSECTTSNMEIEIPSVEEEEVVESIPEQLVEEEQKEAEVADKVEITDSAVVTETHEEPVQVEQDEEIKEKEAAVEQVVSDKVEVKKQAAPVQPKKQPVQQQNYNQNKHNNNKQNFNKQNKQQLPKANTEL